MGSPFSAAQPSVRAPKIARGAREAPRLWHRASTAALFGKSRNVESCHSPEEEHATDHLPRSSFASWLRYPCRGARRRRNPSILSSTVDRSRSRLAPAAQQAPDPLLHVL